MPYVVGGTEIETTYDVIFDGSVVEKIVAVIDGISEIVWRKRLFKDVGVSVVWELSSVYDEYSYGMMGFGEGGFGGGTYDTVTAILQLSDGVPAGIRWNVGMKNENDSEYTCQFGIVDPQTQTITASVTTANTRVPIESIVTLASYLHSENGYVDFAYPEQFEMTAQFQNVGSPIQTSGGSDATAFYDIA